MDLKLYHLDWSNLCISILEFKSIFVCVDTANGANLCISILEFK